MDGRSIILGLVGDTGVSLIDFWTPLRLFCFFSLGDVVASKRMNRGLFFIISVVMAVEWEFIDWFAEGRWATVWVSPESWLNRAGDLLTTGGVLLAFRLFDRRRLL